MAGSVLWTLPKVLRALGGKLSGSCAQDFSAVVFDSRQITGGEIFFAIKGIRMDGHAFVVSALKAGASLAVVSHTSKEMLQAGPLLVVDNTLTALQDLGRAGRERTWAKVVGITGSVGKTTTKDMLALALGALGPVHAADASFNNHWGVPLTLARIPYDTSYAVIEMGMNAPGEIANLTAMARPDVAVVLTIAESHIGAFGNLKGIARAKAEIFAGLAPGGIAVLNRDMAHFDLIRKAAVKAGALDIITFGRHDNADVRLTALALKNDCVCVDADIRGQKASWRVGMPGAHVAENSLAVAAVILALEGDMTAIHALVDMKPPKGRGGRYHLAVPGGEVLLVDESYNANPASVRAALAGLAESGAGRKLAVLGDMLELGEAAEELHAGLAGAVDESHIDALYACGPLMKHLWNAVPERIRAAQVATSDELPAILRRDLRPGDVVMIKGSLSSRMGVIVDALRDMFEPSAKREG